MDVSFGSHGEDTAGLGFPVPSLFNVSLDTARRYCGHVGGYLPVVVFVFAAQNETWQFDYAPVPEPLVAGQHEQRLFFRALQVGNRQFKHQT